MRLFVVASTWHSMRATLIILCIFITLGCDRTPENDSLVGSKSANGIPDSELIEIVRRFYVDGLATHPETIRPSGSAISSDGIKAFVVICAERGHRSHCLVDVRSGIITRLLDFSASEEGYRVGVLREFYPEKYKEYLHYKASIKLEREMVDARVGKLSEEMIQAAKNGGPAFGRRKKIETDKLTPKELGDESITAERRELLGELQELWKWRPIYERVSRESALDQVKPVLEHYGVSEGAKYRFEIEANDKPEDSQWRIEVLFARNGAVYEDGFLFIELSRYSGRITRIVHEP